MSTLARSDPATRTRWLGWTLIVLSVATAIGFAVLTVVFDFPAILRAPASEALPLFAEHASTVRPTYWVLAMTGLALIAASVGLGRLLAPTAGASADLVVATGVATGVFWSLGYSRWPITVPFLSELYESGERQHAGDLYELINRYAGMTVGEHLGFLTMGVFALAFALRRAGIGPRWFFAAGIVSGVAIAVTSYEQYDNDVHLLGELNGVANTISFLWLIAVGGVLIRRDRVTERGPRSADAA